MSLGTGELVRKMPSVLLSLLPSVLVLLFSSVLLQPGKYEVLAFPIAIPRPPPGSKVVIVVGGNGGNDGAVQGSTMVAGESQIHERKSMILHPSSLQEIKRQGHLNKQGSFLSPLEVNKNEKSLIEKILPSSPRHISGGPSDIFHLRKKFSNTEKMISNEKQSGPDPRIIDFRPHQPDITSDIQNNNGKLSLPVLGFADDNNGLGTALGTPSPTPMANKLNPYTNGVAASFPPGIDPYEGFIRYAAENLDTPMGNVVDYHSLEHYYGPQHPLSPYHSSKESASLRSQPYADSFSYNNGIETGNSPPPPAPPHLGPGGPGGPPPPPPYGFGERPEINDHGGGFRTRDHALGGRPGGPRDSNHNPVSSPYEHGVDHFHAPSPGLGAAPPRPPRPPTSDPALYEEEHQYRSPPFEPPPPGGGPPYRQNHHAPPFKHSPPNAGANSLQDDDGRSGPPPHGHSPDPPDLDVYEEGPPPPGSHPILPPPSHHQGQNGPHHAPSQPEQENNDGGDDAIWGILDLAEMLEKGQLPGQGNSNTASATPGGGKSQASPQIGPGGRVVVPIFTRPPPPRAHAGGSSDSPDEVSSPDHGSNPPHIPPIPAALQANAQKGGYPVEGQSDGGFDYDDHPGGGNGRPSSYGGPMDSQEANDYGDDSYSK